MLAKRCESIVTKFSLLTVASVASVALLSGCASMVSSKEELQNLGGNEGIVFGSIVINIENGGPASDAKYWLRITKSGCMPCWSYADIKATPENEEIFIKKLPEGDYQILGLEIWPMEIWRFPAWRGLPLRANFKVTPKQTTYIGKFTVQFPVQFPRGVGPVVVGPVRKNVVDAQRETTERLRNEYESSLSNVVKALMVIER